MWIWNGSWNSNHTVEASSRSSSFSPWCKPAYTHSCFCMTVCVCVCDYFGLLLLTHSCRVCLTAFCHQIGLAGFSRNCCSHIAAAASDSWISQISVNRKHMMWCVYVWFTPLPTAVIGFHLNAQKNAAWHDWQNRKQT